MTDSNRTSLSFNHESGSYGSDPGISFGGYRAMRTTSESLHQETSSTSSAELRSDRQVPAVSRTNLSVAGDTAWELTYDDAVATSHNTANFNLLLQSVLMSPIWDAGENIPDAGHFYNFQGGTVNSADQDIDATSNFFDVAWREGRWIKISASANNGQNDGYYKIKTRKDSDEIRVEGSQLVTNTSDGDAVIDLLPEITNGTTAISHTIVKEFTDTVSSTDGRFVSYGGMMVDSMTITVAPESIITGSFTWIGQDEEDKTTHNDSSQTDANTNDPMNSIDNIVAVREGRRQGDGTLVPPGAGSFGGYQDVECTGFSFTINNNLRARYLLGELGTQSIGMGTCNVSGTLTKYYENKAMMDQYLDFDTTSLAFIAEDTDGNAYIFDFPAVKFTSGQRVAGGQNQDIIADMAWEALRDPIEGITMRIAKYTA